MRAIIAVLPPISLDCGQPSRPSILPKSSKKSEETMRAADIRCLAFAALCMSASGVEAQGRARFDISFPATAHAAPVTGRVYVMITRNEQKEPRQQINQADGIPFFGRDIVQLAAGASATIDETDLGYPVDNL